MAITKVITELTDLNQANSENGLKMPTGGAFSGTPAEGMMRNDTTQSSEGSASTMQHYNGTAWKNFSNKAPIPNTLDYLIIAGGGSGGSSWGGGGGAGGLRTTFGTTSGGGASAEPTLTLSAMTYTITVGTGGAKVLGNAFTSGNNGNASSLDATSGGLFQTVGGGAGGTYVNNTNGTDGNAGGSGGGGGVLGQASPFTKAGGAGTNNEGFACGAGGFGSYNGTVGPGGGGGASAVGNASSGGYRTGGNGGAGLSVEITGAAVTYAGGGGGGSESGASTGGAGGGGAGGTANTSNGVDGTDGLGGGGGGCGNSGSASRFSGDGGDGVVILRLPTARYSGNTTGSPTVTTVSTAYGTDTILTYTAPGGTYVHS